MQIFLQASKCQYNSNLLINEQLTVRINHSKQIDVFSLNRSQFLNETRALLTHFYDIIHQNKLGLFSFIGSM